MMWQTSRWHWLSILLLSGVLAACGGGSSSSSGGEDDSNGSGDTTVETMAVRGVDVSTLAAVEAAGGHFQDANGTAVEPMAFMASQGVNLVRLRLWVDPKSATGDAYGAGDLDLDRVTALAKRVKAAGMKFMLDLHYSDFWTDPGKQFKPKAWADLDSDALVAQVQSYSQAVVAHLIDNGVHPEYIQVGNELNSGMLWPNGKNWGDNVGGFDTLAALLKAGVAGIQQAESDGGVTTPAKIILHLAEGGKNGTFRWWFDEITARAVPFDIIGASYYPYWHGSLADLQANLNDMVSRYGKPVMVVETAYGFTTDNGDSLGNNFGTSEETAGGYPVTAAGQLAFLTDLRSVIAAVPDEMGLGFVYWEPAWLPVDGVSWATEAGMDYIETSGSTGNAWENQALFDFNGDALAGWAAFAKALQ